MAWIKNDRGMQLYYTGSSHAASDQGLQPSVQAHDAQAWQTQTSLKFTVQNPPVVSLGAA